MKSPYVKLAVLLLTSAGDAVTLWIGGLSKLFGVPLLGPATGLGLSLFAWLWLVYIMKSYRHNNLATKTMNLVIAAAIITTIIFALSLVLMLAGYNRSFYGDKVKEIIDTITIGQDSTRVAYIIRAETDKTYHLNVLFSTDDEEVSSIRVKPAYITPTTDTKHAVDMGKVRTTTTEPKRVGYLFLEAEDANDCKAEIIIVPSSIRTKHTRIMAHYTYYRVTKWEMVKRWLLERYYQ